MNRMTEWRSSKDWQCSWSMALESWCDWTMRDVVFVLASSHRPRAIREGQHGPGIWRQQASYSMNNCRGQES
jgi:hypothetical protein